jgi:phosphoribosylglycinamide formyltransferase-1
LAILASGTGTILEAILEQGLPVAVVISDRKCRALEVAETAGIPTELVERTDFTRSFDRQGHTDEVIAALHRHGVTVVAMAGYMTIFSPSMFETFAGRVLNTHPSLLPAFPGAHAVRDALVAGVPTTGCTVHLATAVVDDGPILAQEAVEVREDDTEDTLHERIKAVERRLYPATIEEFLHR